MNIAWKRATIAGALICLFGIGYVAWGANAPWKAPAYAAAKKNPVPVNQGTIAVGKILYTQQCMACHGTTGKGNGPAARGLQTSPGDLTSQEVAKQTDGELFWKITEGRSPMPTFAKTLTDQQRWQVINYIRTFEKPGGKK